jgi:GNAT superfamily N-acetyltransferase
MDIPLSLVTPEDLQAAFESNLIALYHTFELLPGAEMVESDRLCYHHAFPSNPLFKAVWRTRLPHAETDAAIDQVIDWFKARNAPYFYWWVDSQAQPSDLPAHLLAKGFTPFNLDLPCMAADLQDLEGIPPPQGFSLRLAGSQVELEQWRDVLAAAYNMPLFAGQAWVDANLSLGIDRAPWQMVLGILDGKPVACGTFFRAGDAIGVLNIGTLESVRGRGIGTAITLQPLLEARQRGCRIAVLFSSVMGYPIYSRLGFQDLDYKLSRYIWYNG